MRSPVWLVSRFTALAVSMTDPPPTATKPSHGPWARAYSPALLMLSSVGSTCTPSKTSDVMPYRVRASAMRCATPLCPTPWSVSTSTRCTPYWARSQPISSAGPGPHISGGAPHVKIVSSERVASNVDISGTSAVSYTHLRAHETRHDLVCRLL